MENRGESDELLGVAKWWLASDEGRVVELALVALEGSPSVTLLPSKQPVIAVLSTTERIVERGEALHPELVTFEEPFGAPPVFLRVE